MIAGLLIAQVEHGPNMHGGALGVAMFLLAIAVVGALGYVVAARRRRDRSSASQRRADVSDRSRDG